MATTDFGVNHPLAVKLYSKRLFYEALKETSVFKFIGKGSDALIQLNPELKEVGDQLTYGLRMLLTGDGVQGDSTLEGNEEALTLYSDSILINQLRHAVRSGGKMSEQRVPYSIREEAMQGLKDWFADRIDTGFFNQICGYAAQTDTKFTGNNTAVEPDSSHYIYATASTAEVSLSASSSFSLALIDRAVTKAKTLTPKIRPLKINGESKFVCFIHPFQTYQLRVNNTGTGQWVDIQKAAMMGGQISKNPIYTGALGEYNNVILHESTRVTQGLSAANVKRAVMCGAQAAVLCTGKQTKAGLDATWVEELFDYKNQLGVAGGLIYGMKKSRFNSADFGTIVISSYSPDPG